MADMTPLEKAKTLLDARINAYPEQFIFRPGFVSEFDRLAANHAEAICTRLVELETECKLLTRSVEHNFDVLSPLFQCGGKYADIGVIGEPLVNSVPRLIEKLEQENAELRARLEEKE